MTAIASVHASAVSVGGRGVLIRGPSGSGKSSLAFELIMAGQSGLLPPALLVGDDRLRLSARGNELIAAPVDELAGLIEVRGLGIRRCDYTAETAIALVVDLDAPDAERFPENTALRVVIERISLLRVPVAAGVRALPLVVAALTTKPYSPEA